MRAGPLSVRVMLPERCWPVETRNCRWQKPVLVSYTTLDIIESWLPLDIEAAQPSHARFAVGATYY